MKRNSKKKLKSARHVQKGIKGLSKEIRKNFAKVRKIIFNYLLTNRKANGEKLLQKWKKCWERISQSFLQKANRVLFLEWQRWVANILLVFLLSRLKCVAFFLLNILRMPKKIKFKFKLHRKFSKMRLGLRKNGKIKKSCRVVAYLKNILVFQ